MADAKRKLIIEILSDAKGVKQGVDEAESAVSGFGGKVAKIGGAIAGAFAVNKIAEFAGDTISSASDLNETVSKTGVIFGNATDDVLAFADGAAKSLGQSKQQALDAASSFALFGKSAGLTGKDLVGFSTDMVGLAGDMASFSNTTPDEAIEAIGAALRGESEPIRKYGVLLDDATLKARAMKLGIYDGTGALSQQQRVMAAQAEILAQTGSAQGDFARTSGGLANQQRIMSAEMENAKAKIGEKLLPVMVALTKFVTEKVIPAFEAMGKWFSDHKPVLIAFAAVVGVTLVSAFAAWAGAAIAAAAATVAAMLPVLAPIAAVAAAVYLIIDNWDVIVDFFQKLPGRILGFLKDLPDLLLDLGKKLLQGLLDGVEWLATTGLKAYFLDIPLKILEWLGDLASLLLPVGKAVLQGFLDGIIWLATTGLKAYFIDIPLKILEWIGNANLWLLDKGKDILLGMVHGLEDAFSDIFTWFFNLPGRILQMLVDAAEWLVDVGRNLVKGIVKGIKEAPGALRDALISLIPGGKSVVDQVLKWVPGLSFAEGGVIPGPRGAPVPILAHGGEFVVSNAMQARGGMGAMGGPQFTINVTAGMGADGHDIANKVVGAIVRYSQSNGWGWMGRQ